MRRRIYSLYTPLMKVIIVPIVGPVVVLILVSILNGSLPLFPDGAIVTVLSLAVLGFFAWHFGRMKSVDVDDDNLYVATWFKGVAIPLSQVEYVYYSPIVGLVFVHLKSPSQFGSTIAFMPTLGAGLLSMLGSRSIAEELRDLAKKASTHPRNTI
jgi:hypothetical protein